MRSLLSVGVLCSLFGLRASGKAVFAHFMIGNTENYGSPDFESEISQAQEAHIDGFALNFAYADYTNDGSIERMFGAAERKGFKLIFSFDYAGNGPFPKEEVDYWLDMYLGSSAYFHHSTGQPLVSTFEGPESADDWIELKKKHNVFFMPSYSSLGAKEAMKTGVPDGLFSWAAWPKGPNDMTTEVDSSYCEFLDKIDCRGGKPYMMPVSPWFYTNLPGYDKNWLWRGDSLWFDRWTHAWTVQPEYVQIISWNDYGESHHIGDVREDALVAFDVGEAPFNYARGRPHAAWRMFLPYVIDIYKVGEAAISKEGISVWYHTNQGRACSSGGTTGNTAAQVQVEGQPADFSQDKIFVSALLGSTANLQIKIGDGSWDVISWDTTPDGNSGLYFGSTPFTGQGQVQVRVMRGPDQVVGLTGAAIDNTSRGCVGGFTNWNAWVGGTWASGGVSASSGDLSGCIRGTGDGDIKTLCEYACKYNYCPFGACTCTQRGKINNADKDAGKGAGYPNPGKECIYLGLCDYACDHGICPTNACNRDEANKGKCFIPPDTPPATPTKKPTTTAAPPEATDHGDPYAEDRDTWANHDKCWIYDPPNHEASVNQCLSGPCKKIVEDAEKEGRTTNYGCLGFWALDQPIPWEDDPTHIGKRTAVGRCQCDNGLVNVIADTFLEALPAIAQIGCFIVMSTIKIVVEFGADAIPGVGEVLDAGLEAAGYAAALIDYYYNVDQKPEEAFDFWLAPCGGSAFVPQEIKDVFDVLSGLDPGRWGFKGGNIPKGKGQKGDKGNPDRKDRDNDQKDVTITQLQADAKTTQVALVTKTEKCDAGKDPQACAHYYSVHENYNWWGKDARFTCTDNNERAKRGKAVPRWKQQHKDLTWRAFTSTDYVYPGDAKNGKPEMTTTPNCEADEYPPAYFVEDDLAVDIPSRTGQIIRWLPQKENGGAGQTWKLFCNKYDGGSGNGQNNKKGEVNKDLVKVKGAPKRRVEDGGKGKPQTTIEIYPEADYTRAVFEMSFHWDGTAPGAGNNWWHSQNPCWPTAIASSDEGYPLLTDDYYYTTHPHKAEAEQRKAMYVDPPPQAILDAAKDKYKDVVLPTKRSLQLGPASLFQLTDGDLALDDGNSTRRLTEDDLPNVAVLDCRDRFCKEELAALEGESGDVVLIPGAPLPTLPPVVEAVATKTSAPLSMQTVVRRSSGF